MVDAIIKEDIEQINRSIDPEPFRRVVSRFIRQSLRREGLTVFGDGSQTRSFCYITNSIVGILLFVAGASFAGIVLNIGHPNDTRIRDLMEKTVQLSSSNSRLTFEAFPPGYHRRRLPAISRARKLINWKAHVDLERGLRKSIELAIHLDLKNDIP